MVFSIKFGLKYLLPLFLITFSILALVFIQLQFFQPNSVMSVPVVEHKNYYPFNTTGSAIVSNSTNLIFFGGTNDNWDGINTIISVNKEQLLNFNNSVNSSSLFHIIGHLPYTVYDMGVVNVGSVVYLFGGFSSYNIISGILEVNMSSWPYKISQVANMSYGLENPIVLRLDNLVYIFGGSNAYIGNNNREIYSFNLTDNSIKDLQIKTPLISPAVEYYNNKVYLIGGIDINTAQFSNSVYEFDPSTKTFNLVDTLSLKIDYRPSYVINNNLFVWSENDGSNYYNQPLALNLDTFKISYLNTNFFTHKAFYQCSQRFLDINYKLWLFGGTNNSIATYSIYEFDLASLFGKPLINNDINNITFNTYNNKSIFSDTGACINYNFTDQRSQLIDPFNPVILNASDSITIKATYYNHNDTDTRQSILIGFTSETPLSPVNLQNSIPSQNFIGLQLRNQAGPNAENYIDIGVLVIKDNQTFLNKPNFLPRDEFHNIVLHVNVVNGSAFSYSLTIDGIQTGTILSNNLENIHLNSFSIWNMNNSVGWPLEGFFFGNVNYFSINHNPILSNNQAFQDGIVVMLLLNLFVIAVLIYIMRTPQYKYLSTGEKPEGISTAIVDLGFYKLYIQLKKIFQKIESFSAVGLEEEPRRLDLFEGKFVFPNVQEPYTFDQETLAEISGIGIKILINLLEYLDHGTYLSYIQVNLGINRSKFYYTVNKLKDKDLIIISSPISDDQRKKFISISPKGYALLQLVYKQLDDYFNPK